jgi:hypothetical protein
VCGGGVGGGMHFECNPYDGLSLARDRRMNQNTFAKLFNTRDKVINDGLLTQLEIFST